MYTSGGRRGVAGRGRASFVECGLILMGTDDKQRKQASSLPGEICLLLAGVQQWGPPTHALVESTPTSAALHQRLPRLSFLVAAVAARAQPPKGHRKGGRSAARVRGRSAGGDRVLRMYTRTCPRRTSRRVASACKSRIKREDPAAGRTIVPAVTYLL